MKTEFNLTVTGQHYFQKLSGPPVPVWDLRADPPFKNNPDAFVVAHKVKSVPSPDGASDVAWLELVKDSGGLANTIYRINTEAGQPAASVSSSVDWCLSCPINVILLYSVNRAIHQVSSIPQNTVRLYDMMSSAWPLLTRDLSSASLKRLVLC
jgi:hypothetical protein